MDYNFTADLENQLDEITSGKIEWVQVLDNFWKDFYENVGKVKEKRTREVLDLLNESLGALIFERDDKDAIDRKCKLCSNGELSLKNSFRGIDIEGETTGLITYMRTDGTNISKEAIDDFRTVSYTHLTLPTT